MCRKPRPLRSPQFAPEGFRKRRACRFADTIQSNMELTPLLRSCKSRPVAPQRELHQQKNRTLGGRDQEGYRNTTDRWQPWSKDRLGMYAKLCTSDEDDARPRKDRGISSSAPVPCIRWGHLCTMCSSNTTLTPTSMLTKILL